MAENQGKLSLYRQVVDDIASERQALTAFGFATHLRISGLGAPDLAAAGNIPQFFFSDCIADADDHVRILLNNLRLGLVRPIRNS